MSYLSKRKKKQPITYAPNAFILYPSSHQMALFYWKNKITMLSLLYPFQTFYLQYLPLHSHVRGSIHTFEFNQNPQTSLRYKINCSIRLHGTQKHSKCIFLREYMDLAATAAVTQVIYYTSKKKASTNRLNSSTLVGPWAIYDIG